MANRLVVEDEAANALSKTWRGYNQFPIGAPGLLGLGDAQFGKSIVARRIAFIHRQQALVVGDQYPRGVPNLLSVHFVICLPGKLYRVWLGKINRVITP